MKKLVRTLFAATSILMMALFALSCTNEPIEMERSVEITIMPEGTLAPFSAIKDRLGMYNDADGVAKVRLTILQYNSKGDLTQEKEVLLKDFNERYTFTTMLPTDGKSRIICYASCIQGSLSNVIYEPYSIKNVERIESITIQQKVFNNYGTSLTMLGWGECSISDNADEQLSLYMEPMVSFVTFHWKYPSLLPSTKGDDSSEYTICFSANDILECNGIAHVPSSSLKEGQIWIHSLSASDIAESMEKGYTGYYADKSFFSCQKMHLYGKFSDGDEDSIITEQSYVNIEAGQIYTIEFDCEAMTCELKNSVFKAPRLRESAFTRVPWLTTDIRGKYKQDSTNELQNAVNYR